MNTHEYTTRELRHIARTSKHEHRVVMSTLLTPAAADALPHSTSPAMGWLSVGCGAVAWRGQCPTCGKLLLIYARPVSGKLSISRECDPRCTSASGHSCECQCAGVNHGKDYAV